VASHQADIRLRQRLAQLATTGSRIQSCWIPDPVLLDPRSSLAGSQIRSRGSHFSIHASCRFTKQRLKPGGPAGAHSAQLADDQGTLAWKCNTRRIDARRNLFSCRASVNASDGDGRGTETSSCRASASESASAAGPAFRRGRGRGRCGRGRHHGPDRLLSSRFSPPRPPLRSPAPPLERWPPPLLPRCQAVRRGMPRGRILPPCLPSDPALVERDEGETGSSELACPVD
jgi:hypothetical protein